MGNTLEMQRRCRLILLSLAGILFSSCAWHKSSAIVQRGWLEPASFTQMLTNNPQTLQAGDRQAPEFRVHPIAMLPTEIARHSTTTFPLTLEAVPVLAALRMSIWHQGTDQKPVIRVNGVEAGTLEPAFPSLAERNYVFFVFANSDGSKNTQVDYQGWLPAVCFINGALLKQGENTITLSVETDQVKIRDVEVEAIYATGPLDTVHDFSKSGN